MNTKSTARIAAAGIAIECATFSPLPSELTDFIVLRGDDLLARYPFADQYEDLKLTPLMQASAVPGGVLRRTVYDALKGEIIDGLNSSGPWQGVYLDMHGAMAVEGVEDAEADFIGCRPRYRRTGLPHQRQLRPARKPLSRHHGSTRSDHRLPYRAPRRRSRDPRSRLRPAGQMPARGSSPDQSLHPHSPCCSPANAP